MPVCDRLRDEFGGGLDVGELLGLQPFEQREPFFKITLGQHVCCLHKVVWRG
ncbi:MAG: hypothetical protein M5R40_18885 [Anaerolineae bacterium]|nr:hypothetical protein [Anaerolineae bacterium]